MKVVSCEKSMLFKFDFVIFMKCNEINCNLQEVYLRDACFPLFTQFAQEKNFIFSILVIVQIILSL